MESTKNKLSFRYLSAQFEIINKTHLHFVLSSKSNHCEKVLKNFNIISHYG